jgi:preprotein translocase subunit YajC
LITIATNVLRILADGGTPAAGPSGQGGQPFFGSFMFPLLMIMIIFMGMQFFSKRKQDKERQSQLAAMKRGDRVQTIGGILGTIVEVREGDVLVKVDESNNTKIKFARSAIARVTTDEDKAEAKS